MATTANGTPYVESSDLVANYPAVSLALAEHIDDNTGKVLQVVSTIKADTFSTSSGVPTFVDVTGLSATITPIRTTSKIMIISFINVGWDNNRAVFVKLLRGSTDISIGDSAGSRTRSSFFTAADDGVGAGNRWSLNGAVNFLDSPATTSATTYKLQIAGDGVDGTNVYVNRTGNDAR
jgi:hypothetical protein